MPYRFLPDIATADVAFDAWGKSREEMFIAAAEAFLAVTVADPETIMPAEKVSFSLDNDRLDMLLFDFLQELIFYKDARQLLLRVMRVALVDGFHLEAEAAGEPIDQEKHPLVVDVKAVTLHLFEVRETPEGSSARIVLDI